jgi:hypothetical protein
MASSADIPGLALVANVGDARAAVTMRIRIARLILCIRSSFKPGGGLP